MTGSVVTYRKFTFAASAALLFVGPAFADPRPEGDIRPIAEGRYETPWGNGSLRITDGGYNANLRLDDGSVVWGNMTNGGRRFQGRWVRVSSSISHSGPLRRCGGRRFNVPSSFPVPSGDYWGYVIFDFYRNGQGFVGRWSTCNTPADMLASDAYRFEGRYQAITSAAPRTLRAPILPLDGPCAATSSVAVASISPCRIEPFRPLKITMLKPVVKGITRITFTALTDDRSAILAAIQQNQPLPLNPSGRTAYTVINGNKLWQRGDNMDVIPPGALCSHDLWAVSITDAVTTYHGLGFVNPACGPGNVVGSPDEPLARPVKIDENRKKGAGG